MANGLMDVLPHQPFSVLLSNFSDKNVRLHKNTTFGLTLPTSARKLTFEISPSRSTVPQSKEGVRIPFILVIPLSTLRIGYPTSSTARLHVQEDWKNDWRDDFNIGEEDETVRKRLLTPLWIFRHVE